MLTSEVMKYSDIDMQEIPRQMSPLTQVQNNLHSIQDRSNWRSRHTDLMNSNGSKDSPEVIDLDGEESPVKEKLESTITVNGVTATVKKVSLPWQDKTSSDEAKKTFSASKEEIEIPENAASENVVSKEVLPTSSEAEESLSSKVTEGGRIIKKKRFSNENSQFMKRTGIKKRNVDALRKSSDGRSQVESNSSQSQGERKRPSTKEDDESSSKRLKTFDNATEESSASSVPAANQINGLAKQDSKEPQVSVVDLVDEEEEVLAKNEEKSSLKEDSAIVEPKNVTQTSTDIKPVSSKNVGSLSVSVENVSSPSSAPPKTMTPPVTSVQSPSPLPSEEKRSKPLSSVIGSGTNGMLTQMQPIEVKKVKLCPSLEKQATAMSTGVTITISTSVDTPKPAPTTTLVQNQFSPSTTSQEAASAPSLVTQKPSTSESAKEPVTEPEVSVSGAELEKKVGLNPAHSLTRKLVKKLTRAELESFLLEMTCDLVFSKSDAGKYRRMYEEMKEISENKSLKIAQLIKQVSDLKAVVTKVVEDQKEKKDIIPHRITRSVGLQLDQSNILNAHKLRSRGEKLHVITPSINSSASNTSPPAAERPQPQRWNRSAPSSTSKILLPSTPNGPVTSPISKDATPGGTLINRSPQRQLRAIHPKLPQTAQSSTVSPATASPSTQSTPSNEPSNKLPGFIDISDESKILNSGAAVGIRRHRAPGMLAGNSPGASGSTNVNINAIANNQVTPPTIKMVQQQYGPPGNVYPQTSAAQRVMTPMNIPPTTPVTGSRLTYLIPTTNAVPVQQRQLLLTSPASSQQIRGRAPVSQGNAVQTMIMRPNTLVQVSSGAISSPSTSIIRTLPTSSIQVLPTVKSQSQHASRVMAMQGRSPAPPNRIAPLQHPAPLPAQPQPTVVNPNLKPIPRRPVLKLSKVPNGIVLSWNMTMNTPHEEIASYQLYAYQEGANSPPSPSLWKKVGDVKALPLPMACTLTQFADGHTYHFAVRALDVHGRVGEFSVPGTIDLFN